MVSDLIKKLHKISGLSFTRTDVRMQTKHVIIIDLGYWMYLILTIFCTSFVVLTVTSDVFFFFFDF